MYLTVAERINTKLISYELMGGTHKNPMLDAALPMYH